MMKAVVVYKPGGPEQLVYTDVPRPALKAGWSLVRVRAFGVNHSEIFTRQGLSPSVSFPRILGIECVGTVEETTDAVRLPAGQRVVSLMGEMGRGKRCRHRIPAPYACTVSAYVHCWEHPARGAAHTDACRGLQRCCD